MLHNDMSTASSGPYSAEPMQFTIAGVFAKWRRERRLPEFTFTDGAEPLTGCLSNVDQAAHERSVAELLALLKGLEGTDQIRIIVVGGTNDPALLDSALKR